MSYEFACTFRHETDSAVLVYDHATEEELWLPLSQVESMHKDKSGKGSIVISDWIAKQKGLI
jgi:hypothetical protein